MQTKSNTDPHTKATGPDAGLALAARSIVGGLLMGLANLVPGISGGTMLLAAGVYPPFVEGIAQVTTLTFRRRSMLVLGCVVAAAAVAFVLFAGPIKNLVVEHRWIMYSLFIGLTLGGVPVVWKLIGRATPGTWVGAACGFCGMVALAWVQYRGMGETSATEESFLLLLVAGVAGASAMIIPGVSGGYLLLVMGTYVPILTAIERFVEAAKELDLAAALDPGLKVMLPVGIGVVVGIVAVSHILKFLLHRCEKATLGVLLGLLLGAVVGLWPFQEGREPAPGEVFRGRTVTAQSLDEIRDKPHRYPTVYFRPSSGRIGGACGLIVLGFVATAAIARFGSGEEDEG